MSALIIGIIVILVLILVIILIVLGIFFSLKRKVERYSTQLFGVKNLFDGINAQKEEMAEEPKTPYGMDNLLMPDITKDFPYMNIDQMKALAEESIHQCFKSISNKSIQSFNNPSEKLINSINETIKVYRNDNISLENINMHKTVINKYTKNGSICTLIFQTSLGYNLVKNGNSKKIEDRINTEFLYIYDDKHTKGTDSISLHCPSCGAPIKGLGHKSCPYCNTGLVDLAPKTWKLNDIKFNI